MAEDILLRLVLAIIVGTLFAIVYSLRIMVLVERRVARIEEHIDNLAHKIVKEEYRLEKVMRKK